MQTNPSNSHGVSSQWQCQSPRQQYMIFRLAIALVICWIIHTGDQSSLRLVQSLQIYDQLKKGLVSRCNGFKLQGLRFFLLSCLCPFFLFKIIFGSFRNECNWLGWRLLQVPPGEWYLVPWYEESTFYEWHRYKQGLSSNGTMLWKSALTRSFLTNATNTIKSINQINLCWIF
jgi:hypothetical protein